MSIQILKSDKCYVVQVNHPVHTTKYIKCKTVVEAVRVMDEIRKGRLVK